MENLPQKKRNTLSTFFPRALTVNKACCGEKQASPCLLTTSLPTPQLMDNGIMQYIGHLSYTGIFMLLAFLDALIPLPEEIILIMVGYTAFFDPLDPVLAIMVSVAAFLAGDTMTYMLSRTGSRLINRFKNRIAPFLLEEYSGRMRENAGLTMLFMTFIPSIRFFAPVVCGAVRIPWRIFFMYDIAAVSLYVSFYLLLGYFFHFQLRQIIHEFELFRHLSFYFISIIAGVWLAVHTKKIHSRYKKQDGAGT
jgi:membrane protein DedA with SNARE-associated domain